MGRRYYHIQMDAEYKRRLLTQATEAFILGKLQDGGLHAAQGRYAAYLDDKHWPDDGRAMVAMRRERGLDGFNNRSYRKHTYAREQANPNSHG